MLTPTQAKARQQRRRFAAAIEQRAAEIVSRIEPVKYLTFVPPDGAVHVEITVHPEPETAVNVVPCECAAVFVSGTEAVDLGPTVAKPGVRVTVVDVQRAVASAFGVKRVDLLSSRRFADIVHPRQVAMYLARELTSRSMPDIGRRFGGRDHTTVLHAIRRVTARLAQDPALAEKIDLLKAKVMAEAA